MTTPPIPLVVSAKQAKHVLTLGATQSGEYWSIPPGVDPFPFYQWIRGGPVNIRARHYWIARTPVACESCARDTKVTGFILPPGHEVISDEDDPPEPVDPVNRVEPSSDEWVKQPHFALLSHIHFLLPTVFEPLYQQFEWLQPRVVLKNNLVRYINICQFCQNEVPDDYIFEEPGCGFAVTTAAESRRIELTRVMQPFMGTVNVWTEELPWLEYRLGTRMAAL
jgi:hypothetical protein